MTPDPRTGERIVLRLSKREGDLFERTLRTYPVLTSGDSRLTEKGGLPDQESGQQLLEQALAEQQKENRRLVEEFLGDPKRFARAGNSVRIQVTEAEVEWLLQVLNDVRVGNWIRLGRPEHKHTRLAISAGLLSLANAQQFWAMEVSGYFQMRLLGKLHPEA